MSPDPLAVTRKAAATCALASLLHAAAGEVASGCLDPQSAAELIADSALAAFQPHHSPPTTTT